LRDGLLKSGPLRECSGHVATSARERKREEFRVYESKKRGKGNAVFISNNIPSPLFSANGRWDQEHGENNACSSHGILSVAHPILLPEASGSGAGVKAREKRLDGHVDNS